MQGEYLGTMGIEELTKEKQDKGEIRSVGSPAHGIRIVQPREPGISAQIANKFCDALEALVIRAFGGSSSKGSLFLQNNFAPVDESGPHANLPIVGSLPECLNGEFVRTGPNPKFTPTAGYHWFDGDGMLHGLRIKDGTATYVSRYVRTSRLKQEEYYGAPKFMKFGDTKGFLGIFLANLYKLRAAMGTLDTEYGAGTANTALVYHNRKLLALVEVDKPYAIRMFEDGNLETIGVLDYEKRLSHAVTAHPKVDPVTGELFFFCYQYESPYTIYRIISKDGTLQEPVIINIPDPIMMHDFAITENYAVFMDLPFIFNPKNLGEGKMIISFDPSRKSRFGVLPRYALNDSQMRWFELPACYIFHTANAWEDGDEVVLVACRMPKLDLELKEDSLQKNIVELYEFRFNLRNGSALQRPLTKGPAVEFPRINENLLGRKQRYVYTSVFHDRTKVSGVAKIDLHKDPELSNEEVTLGSNVDGLFLYGNKRYGSEAVFVPASLDKDTAEDDGYLITFVYDEIHGKSEAVVINAKTMASEPVAVVSIPKRIPYGFHAIFVTEEQLQSQLA